MEMSLNELSELTGLNYRTIKNRLKTLAPCREDGRSHFYETRDALKLLYPTVATELAAETLLLERARREKIEIEVGRMRGELLPVGDVAKVLGTQFSYLRAKLRALPSKMAKPLSMVSDPNEVFTMLADLVDECLSELTADANYQLENDRIVASRADVSAADDDRPEADAAPEPGGVGGQVPLPQSGE